MTTLSPRQRPFPQLRTSAGPLTLLGSAVVGALISINVKIGIAALFAFLYGSLTVVNLGAALAIWTLLPFLAGISALNSAGKAAGLVVAAIWFIILGHQRAVVRRVIDEHQALLWLIVGLCLWVTLSTLWAAQPSLTLSDLWHWYAVALIFLILVSTIRMRRVAQLLVLAFVLGALFSVVYGLAGGISGAETINTASYGGRLGGATGDPNFLAAGVVPAIAFAAALLPAVRELPRALRRAAAMGLFATLAVLVIGLVSSQSRGGIVAALAALAVAMLAFPAHRRWVVMIVLVLIGVTAVTLAISPAALQRVSSFGSSSGRLDEWTVASRIFAAHPFTGAGDANFVAVARDYTRLPGTLTHAQYLVSQPHVAHNTWLQFLSETGVIGLTLFAGVVGVSLRTSLLAARAFARVGDHVMEVLSRGAFVGLAGMLTASTFISAEVDQRLWVLLALGPALLGIARAAGRDPAVRRDRARGWA